MTAVIAFFAGVAFMAGRTQKRQSLAGQEGFLRQRGPVLSPSKARVLGEIWRVKARMPLLPGQEVVVHKVEGLTLWVESAPDNEEKQTA
ncbi:hypothetical protein DFAR_3200021 [Desulfarculales bacterium]